MKQVILITSSLALLSLVPAAAADISILGGTAVIHTDGDPGVSVLGSPVVRVGAGGPCFAAYSPCTFVYGEPGGLTEYRLTVYNGIGSCNEAHSCVVLRAETPATGDLLSVYVLVDDDPLLVASCFLVDCVAIFAVPLCIVDLHVGEIICET